MQPHGFTRWRGTPQSGSEEPSYLGKVTHRGIAGRAFLRLVDRQRVNVSSADIPGPEVPLYFAGAGLLEVFPMVQLLGKNSSQWAQRPTRDGPP